MVRRVCLGEDEHAVTILRGVEQMKLEDDFSDFTIKVEGNEYPVHRVIIAVASPYFKAMLRHDTIERRERKVEMKDVDFKCVASCIDFIYSGSFDIPDGKIGELLHVAIMMQLEKVKEAVCKILDEELNTENFYQTRSIAEMYQLHSILKKCKIYYNENFITISAQPDFQNEEKSHLITIFKLKKLKLSEDDKLAASLRWAGNDPLRKESLLDLVKCVNLKEVSKSYLRDLLCNHPVISNDFFLYKLLSGPLLHHNEQVKSDLESSVDESLILFDNDADCLRSYDPTTDQISTFHNEKFKHLVDFTAVSMGPYIYILDGNKSVHRLDFKDKNSKWERMKDMIEDHGWLPPAVASSGSIFVVGCSNGRSQFTKVVERFDPVANQWWRLQDRPLAIQSHSVVSLDGSIYCIGGEDVAEDVATLSKFTPSTSKWLDLKPMKNARSGFGAVAVEQKIFVMGGFCRSEEKNEVECYDVTSGQWTSLSPTIRRQDLNVACHIKGSIYSIDCGSSSTEIEKYDIVNDKWSKVESISTLTVYDCVICR